MSEESGKTRPKVIYWATIPSPYLVERLNILAGRGNLDLEVWFNARSRRFRAWHVDEGQWGFKYRYLKAAYLFSLDFGWPPLLQRSVAPDVLFTLYSEPIFLLGLLLARIRGFMTVLFVERSAPIWSPSRWWKEALKRFIFRRVDGLAHIGEETRIYARRYSGAGQRFFYLPHVIDVAHFSRAAEMPLKDREEIRGRLGVRGVVYLYVGRLLRLKGLDCLLEAFSMLQKEMSEEISLLLVGDGDYEGPLRAAIKEKGLRNVHLPGFMQKEKLLECYAAADVFVLPTRGDVYGLVVDEAFAAGLPVICTDAAGEIGSRIKDGISGFIVPAEDEQALSTKMKELASSPELRQAIGAEARDWIKGRDADWWARLFEQMVGGISADKDIRAQ